MRVKREIGLALGSAQFGETSLSAKPWKGLGSGFFEIAENFDGDAYRAVYTVRFEEVVYVLHAFQRKPPSGMRTAQHDVDLIGRRLKVARSDYERRNG